MDALIRHQPLLFSLALLIWGAPMAATAAEQPLQQDRAQTTNVQPSDDDQAGTEALAKAAEPVTAKPPAASCRRSRALNLGVTKSVKRPPTNNPLDSFTHIAGIRCHKEGWLEGDFMLTDTPGFRELADKGLDFMATYYPDMSWSSYGAPGYSSMYLQAADLYTGKTGFLWPDGQLHFSSAGWTGAGIQTPQNHSPRFEGSPPLENWRIFELWYGQKFTPQFEVRIGKIYPWVRFASHQTSGIFQNAIFDYPGVYGSTDNRGNFLPYANAPLGIQLSYNPNPHNQFLLNVSDGKDDATGGYRISLADTTLNSDDGIEIIAEYAYLNHSKNPKALPGYYKIGFQGNTGRFTDFSTGLSSWGNYGGYLTIEQMLYAEPNTEVPRSQGLLAFGKLSSTFGNNSIVNLVASTGLTYAGLIPGRDSDMAGIGVAYAGFNSAASRFYAPVFNGVASPSETALEAVYLAELTPWLMLIASYQYVISPSLFGVMNPAQPSGHVISLNTRIAF
jgi:porin